MKTTFQSFLLLSCGLLMALLIGEVIARVIYTKPWYDTLIEEQFDKSWEAETRRNSQGLRDIDYPEIKPQNSHRVLILGDSFTFGKGVADESTVFPEILEQQLNVDFSHQKEIVEVLNGGIPGSLTHQWVDLLLKTQESFKPDVILIVFFLRDGTQTSSMGSFFGPIRNEIKNRNETFLLYQYSYLIRLIKDYQDRRHLANKYSVAMMDSYLGSKEETQEWENAKSNILKIKAIAENSKAKVGFVVFPILVELNDHYPFTQINEKIINFTTENNIPTHDLLPAFRGQKGADLWVSAFDQHPNALGHKIAAKSIQPFLKQLIEE